MTDDDKNCLIGFYEQCFVSQHRGFSEMSYRPQGGNWWTLSIIRHRETHRYFGSGSTVRLAIESLRSAQEKSKN